VLLGESAQEAQAATAKSTDTGWSILLLSFTTGDHRAAAQRSLSSVLPLVKGAQVRTTDKGSVVVVGSFSDASDAKARAELDRIKSIEFNGGNPFARAYLVPPINTEKADAYSLRSLSARKGDKAYWSLHIALFEGRNHADRAREMVKQLRAEGLDAYDFGGPDQTAVTVGVFRYDEVDLSTMIEGPRITAIRGRYPYMLKNGEPMPQRGGSGLIKPMIVQIPD
jgi:hypothetical protein